MARSHRLVGIFAVGLALAVIAGACGSDGDSEAAAPAKPCSGPAEVTDVTLMSDWFLWAATGPFASAVADGYFAEEGLEVTIVPAADAAAPVKFVARDRVQFALSYVPETLQAQDAGIPVISVGTTLRVLQSALAYWPDLGITEPADIAGKTIGVTNDLQTQTYFDQLLVAAGLTRDDVNIVDPGWSSTSMLAERTIDGSAAQLVFTDQVRFPALVNETPSWFLYTDYGVPDYYWMLILASEDFANENPNTVCRFLRATAKGIDTYLSNPGPANELIYAENDSFSLDVHTAMGANLANFWKDANGRSLWQDPAVWQEAQRWALEIGLITMENDSSAYFTNDFLPEG